MQQRGAILTCLVALVPLLAGCGGSMAEFAGGTAQVRFVAVAAGTPATDFYVNGTGAAYGLGYESFTSYLPVGTGAASVAVHRGGAAQALVAAQGALAAGQQYTVVLGAHGGALQERIYADQEQPARAGQISLRILNAMESASPVFYISPAGGLDTAAAVATVSLQSGEAGAYVSLPAGAYLVSATLPGGALHLPVASLTVKATSGSVRTVVFAGAASAQGRNGVVAFTLSDADPT